MTLKNTFNPQAKNWEMKIPFTTGNDITTSNVIYSDGVAGVSQAISIGVRNSQLFIYLSSNGTTWDIAQSIYAFYVNTNTSYVLKVSFDGSDYKTKYSVDNGETWLDGLGVTSSTPIYHAPIAYIGTSRGSAEFLGSIDVANMDIRVQDNLWINPQEQYTAQLDNISNWQDFNDVLLLDSSVTVGSGVITDLEQPKYNNSHITPNKQYISGLGMPSNKYIDLTLLSSGSTYTAPANGYYYLSKITNGANQNIVFGNTTKNFTTDAFSSVSGIALNANIVVEKGDFVNITYSAGGTTNVFRFIYANGEV